MGRTAMFGPNSVSNKLKKGVTIMRPTLDECEKYSLATNITRLVCTKRLNYLSKPLLNSSLCKGDSGSPSHQQYGCHALQIGVLSYGAQTVSDYCGQYSGYVRVSEYMPWIRSEIMNEMFVRKTQITQLRVS